MVRAMRPEDWPQVSRIYAEGMATGIATFETEVPGYPDWDAGHCPVGRLVVEDDGRLLGWAALAPTSRRYAYRGVAEISIYVGADSRGSGVGALLMQSLVEGAVSWGYWTLYASLFPENRASIRLHERNGFRYIGRRERIAQRLGRWHDNLLFEKRLGADNP